MNMTIEQLQAELTKAQARITELESNNHTINDSKFKNVIDASPVPYALNDEAQNITYLNPAFIEIFGYDQNDIPTLADWWPRAYPDSDYQQWVARTWQIHLDKAKQTNSVFKPIELVIHCKDGSQRTVLASAVPLSESYIGNHLVILYDITERKKAEAERERLERELQQVHKMESLGHLTGGIAHDFNNLLGIMSGFTELCLELGPNMKWEKLSGYLHQIHDAGERATSLVSQMLAFSRNDQVENQVMDIAPIVKQDIKMLRAILPSTIKIELEIDENLPATTTSPTAINQVLMNLAINARDAMNDAGHLSISLCRIKDINAKSFVSHRLITGDWVELAVSDNGSGIDPAIINDIFTPFYTSKAIGSGTGMGLAVIYGIVKSCNGHILVESEVDKGSTFRILFPPIIGKHENISDTNLSSIPHVTGQGKEILIVDDEPSLALLMGDIVSNYGYQKMIVTDSTEAQEIFEKEPDRFSIVITDQTMPNLTGMDLIAQLRIIKPNLPAIICSGYSDKIDKKEADSLNIGYFQKPVNTKDLILKIDELLNEALKPL